MSIPPLPLVPPIPQSSLDLARRTLLRSSSSQKPLTPDVKGALTIDDMIRESKKRK